MYVALRRASLCACRLRRPSFKGTSWYAPGGDWAIARTNKEAKLKKPHVAAGHFSTGNVADTPMRVSSGGTTDLHSLVMLVIDADWSFSTPAKLSAR